MTTASSTLLGRPVWYELMTSDTAAAETFYKNVVGWTSGALRRLARSLHRSSSAAVTSVSPA